jgi:Xaa-Pro aminopeptidase
VFFAYAIVTHDSATLFINPAQLDDEARKHLGDSVKIETYTAFFDALRLLGANNAKPEAVNLRLPIFWYHPLINAYQQKVLLSDKASLAVQEAVGGSASTLAPSPVARLKSRKNEVEVDGFRASHARDGAALARYFSWLERSLNKGERVSEIDGAQVLERFRSEGEHFKGLSFETISASGPNGGRDHLISFPMATSPNST